ncbi:MAG TPA: N-acetylmuramoyl-L-alanine amidase [Acidimicrobiales bacterium]|jgi:N-acetylmuramoyl-L-alanine amidase|nr:N-acetylmuramoyl-L-alanine amidase [Acidimicrobiales bacterium]
MHHRTVQRLCEPAERPLWWARHRVACALVLAVVAVLAQSPGWAGAAVRSSVGRLDEGSPIDTKLFQPGACMEYAPTAGDRHLTVFLDAGHGGLDPGGVGETTSGQTIDEADETLPVELDTMALLRAEGFTVVVSRTKAETVARFQQGDVSGGLFTVQGEHDDVAARDVCANMAKANALVGIYFDAGGSSLDAGSVTGYDTARPFSAQNLKLATLVQTDVMQAMNARGWGIPDLGVVDDSELGGPALTTAAAAYDHLLLLGPADPGYSATPSGMPGALIEPLFITDPYEGSIADSASGQQVMAGGLAQAIAQYFAPTPPGGSHAEADRPTKHGGSGGDAGVKKVG